MSGFEFVNHDTYPEDPYIVESCTLCFEGKYRVVYLRKKMKTGGMFWDEMSSSVVQGGEKKFLKAFSTDSNFLRENVMNFLNGRKWEKSVKLSQNLDEVPF